MYSDSPISDLRTNKSKGELVVVMKTKLAGNFSTKFNLTVLTNFISFPIKTYNSYWYFMKKKKKILGCLESSLLFFFIHMILRWACTSISTFCLDLDNVLANR